MSINDDQPADGADANPFQRFLDQTALPDPPPWRDFTKRCPKKHVLTGAVPASKIEKDELKLRAERHVLPADGSIEKVIWAARVLRRPILVTGDPGVGKSSLAHVAAHYFNLGPVLRWNVTSRTTLRDGLYDYDAIARIQKVQALGAGDKAAAKRALKEHGEFFRLGPLGTALLPRKRPRVLLIDEIDKSDLDLPNDMLHVLEEGWFEIPELIRLRTDDPVPVTTADSVLTNVDIIAGKVQCYEFPLIFMTSNGERDFPSAFLRRCLRLTIPAPSPKELQNIVKRQMSGLEVNGDADQTLEELTTELANRVGGRLRTTDQLLNTFFLRTQRGFSPDIAEATFRDVTQSDVPPPPNEDLPNA